MDWPLEAGAPRCRLCRAAQGQHDMGRERLLGAGQSLLLCEACGGVYLFPDFTDEALARFYRDEYRRLFLFEAARAYDDVFFRHSLRAEYAERRARWLAPHVPADGHVFELGAGCGSFLRALADVRPEATIFAAEPDLVLRAARELPGRVSFVEPAAIAGGAPYHLIVAFHVLEHLKDPAGFLAAARGSLHEDGVLVLEVPDILGDWRDWSFVHPAHVSYFSASSLGRLLQRCDLDIVDSGAHPLGPAFEGTLFAIARRPRSTAAARSSPAARKDEIAALRAHILARSWGPYDSFRRFAKNAAIRIFGTARLGRLVRWRYHRRLAPLFAQIAAAAPRGSGKLTA
jgi:Methyltransferase domain